MISICLAALAAAFLGGCAADETGCTQAAVDACYAGIGCDGGAVCELDAAGLNDLCACLAPLDCDEGWYHTFCDGAPYAEDGGCPVCGQ